MKYPLGVDYINSYFVVENIDDYGYLYDDCIIDFDYILCMVNSLIYSYCTRPHYLSSFLKKNVTDFS